MEYGLVLWWLATYLAFMAVGMPLAAVLFPRLADRGAGAALPTALAVLWIVAYLVGHVELQRPGHGDQFDVPGEPRLVEVLSDGVPRLRRDGLRPALVVVEVRV